MRFFRKIFLANILLVLFFPLSILAFDIPDKPSSFVNDFASLYSADFKNKLETNLSDFETKTTSEISVVTIPSLGDKSIEEEAISIVDKWKIGKKGKDNGLLLLISKNDKKVRIEVGYGLEPVITDGRSGRIIREQISPAFKVGNFEAGTWAAVTQIEEYISSNKSPDEIEMTHNKIKDAFWPITKVIAEFLFQSGFIIFIFPLLAYFAAFLGRSKRIWPGGLMGGVLGFILGLVFGTIIALFLSTLILGLLGLFLDFLLSKNYQQRQQLGKSTSFWGSGGGFFGRSGGFGGFGGGSSGGGGASGDW
jgi:uncharacterized protein